MKWNYIVNFGKKLHRTLFAICASNHFNCCFELRTFSDTDLVILSSSFFAGLQFEEMINNRFDFPENALFTGRNFDSNVTRPLNLHGSYECRSMW